MKELTLDTMTLEMFMFRNQTSYQARAWSADRVLYEIEFEDGLHEIVIPRIGSKQWSLPYLLGFLGDVERLIRELSSVVYDSYRPYVSILEFQMHVRDMLKNDLLYVPFETDSMTVFANPVYLFSREVKKLQGTGKSGEYYDDNWDDWQYKTKMRAYEAVSNELYQNKSELAISKRGRVADIQQHLYQLMQLLPTMTAVQTHKLREFVFQKDKKVIVFAVYRLLQQELTHDEQVIYEYLWYFLSTLDTYREIVHHMESHEEYQKLSVVTKDTTVQELIDLVSELDKTYDISLWGRWDYLSRDDMDPEKFVDASMDEGLLRFYQDDTDVEDTATESKNE